MLLDGAFPLFNPGAGDHVLHEPIEIAPAFRFFAEVDARGHMQEIADRRPAIFDPLKARHITPRSSSTDLIAPSEIARPINRPAIDLTIDWETNRSRSVRPYW